MADEQRLICAASEVAEKGRGVRFAVRLPSASSALPAFVVRFDGVARAYLNQCAHTPIELDWNPGEFFDDSRLYLICATHGALYAPENGRCLGGRCRGHGGLRPLQVREIDDAIYLEESGMDLIRHG